MQPLIENLKNQSVKSLFISIVATTAALYILQITSNFILGGGPWLNLNWLISTILTNLFVCFGAAMLMYQKGLHFGLSIGLAMFIIVTLPFIFGMGISSTTLSYLLIGLVSYLLPGAILGYFRKN